MESAQTLHAFVLDLLNNPTALTSFATDPQGALSAAGLGDINAADVHQAIPLVLDYAPAHAVSALEAAQSTLSLDGLADSGPAGAIQQLTALTDSLGTSGLHIDTGGGNAVIAGALSAPEIGTSIFGTGSVTADGTVGGAISFTSPVGHYDLTAASSAGDIQTTAYSAASDLTGGLDTISKVTGGELNANALSGAAAFATNLVSDPTAALANPTEITNALTGAVSSVGVGALPVGDPTSAVTDTLHSVLANVPNPGDLTGSLGNLGSVGNLGGISNLGNLGNVTSTLGNLTHDPLGAVTQHLPAGVTDLVSGTVSQVTSQIPGASDTLHSATTDLHTAVSDVTSTVSSSPLDGVSAGSVGDTVSHATSDVTNLVHNILPVATDHPLF